MSGFEFIAALVGHLSWPVTVITALLVLKRPIADLIPKIRRAKWGDRELEFGEQVEVVRAEVEQLPGTGREIKALPAPTADELPAGTPPRLVVMHHYGLVEQEVLALAVAAGLEIPASNSSTRGVFDLLFREGVTDKATYEALMDLRRLRNVAAHKTDREITDADARDYAEAAQAVRSRLNWIRQRLEARHGAER
jgi:hypothetical protein